MCFELFTTIYFFTDNSTVLMSNFFCIFQNLSGILLLSIVSLATREKHLILWFSSMKWPFYRSDLYWVFSADVDYLVEDGGLYYEADS